MASSLRQTVTRHPGCGQFKNPSSASHTSHLNDSLAAGLIDVWLDRVVRCDAGVGGSYNSAAASMCEETMGLKLELIEDTNGIQVQKKNNTTFNHNYNYDGSSSTSSTAEVNPTLRFFLLFFFFFSSSSSSSSFSLSITCHKWLTLKTQQQGNKFVHTHIVRT